MSSAINERLDKLDFSKDKKKICLSKGLIEGWGCSSIGRVHVALIPSTT